MAYRAFRLHLVLTTAALLTAACGGGQEEATDPFAVSTNTPPPSEDKPPKSAKDSPSKSGGGGADDFTDAQREQMEIALRRGGDKAANCAAVVPEAARGEGEVKVTFDGKKGRSTDAVVGPPWAGTPAESCIKRSFVGEIIVPFDGMLEVPYTVKLPPKPGEADPKDAKGKDAKGKDPKKK